MDKGPKLSLQYCLKAKVQLKILIIFLLKKKCFYKKKKKKLWTDKCSHYTIMKNRYLKILSEQEVSLYFHCNFKMSILYFD